MKTKLHKEIEDKVIADVKEVLAEIDIESQVEYYTDPKRIKEAVKRGIEDIVYRELSQEIHLQIKRAVYKRAGAIWPAVEQRVNEIIAQEFKL